MTLIPGGEIIVAEVLALLSGGNDVNRFTSLPPLAGLQAAPFSVAESSGAGTTKPLIPMLSFDAATDEGRIWIFRATVADMALHYSGYMAGANTSKTVCMVAQLAAISPGDASVTAKVFAAVNSKVKTVPDAAGTQFEDTITLTNDDSVAVGDWVCLVVYRDISEDDAAGDFNMIQINTQAAT